MLKRILLLLFVSSAIISPAQTQLPAFFSNNMILQQNEEVAIWGTDKSNTKLKITGSWGKEVSTKADKEGKWQVKLPTPVYGGPYTLTISGSEEITFTNVLIGEVWLCSGQSNMEMPMKGFPNSPINGSNEAILNAKNSNIRLFHTRRQASLTPKDDVEGQWTEATPATVKEFSAVAYFFGKKINDVTGVPIGLINSSWGGSSAEAWTDIESLKQFADIEIPTEIKAALHTPTALYNGMIAPFIGYNIRGALWNQGETNRVRAEQYKTLLPAMIKGWRDKWGIGNFSFYLSQVPPFYYGTGTISPFIVESQVYIMQHTENTGLATTTDIGNCEDIHAPEKKLISDRLAYWALAKDYGFETVAFNGPIYKSFEITEDKKMLIHFEDSDRDRGLTNNGNKYDVAGFEIASADKVFHPAKASISRNKTITVWSDEVTDPVAARYAFGNCIIGTLFNTAGIPAASFRTDNWQE